jgi:3-oxoadipate enol-lactonase
MNKTVVIFCLLVSLVPYSFSQKQNNTYNLTIDSGYVHVDGGKLFYEIAGTGEYIILLHDGLVHREIWEGQFLAFAKKYRVLRYDRRGFGKSSIAQSPYSNLDDLNDLYIQLKIEQAILVGMSAGGSLAINFALKYPERVNGLVLVGAVVSGYGYSTHFLTRGGHITSLNDYLDPQKFINYFGWEDPYEIYPKNMKAKEKCLKLLETNPGNVNGALGYFQKPPERSAVKFLSEIKVRTLVLVGEFDIPDVHAHAGVIESGIPHAKREIIPSAGHLIPLEQPEAFNASVFKFLRSMEFFTLLNTQGVESAVHYFQKHREGEPNCTIFDEVEMNALGYSYLGKNNTEEAIKLFTLNTIAYPQSANVYDSLGEAYMKAGKKELAIENYEKSLKLNPHNTNAVEQLKKLNK